MPRDTKQNVQAVPMILIYGLSSVLKNTASFLIPVVILEKSLDKDLTDIIASFVDKGLDLSSCTAKSLCTFASI